MKWLIICIIAYLIGAFPFERWFLQYQRRVRLIWLGMDLVKGAVAVLVGLLLHGVIGGAVAAVLVVFGCLFSIFIPYESSRVLAVSAGALFVLSPLLIGLACLIFLLSLLLTRYQLLATILALLTVLILGLVLVSHLTVWVAVLCVSLLIFVQQKSQWKGWKKRN
jgi:glycerol-3-phosphate acyltransferase PlsY